MIERAFIYGDLLFETIRVRNGQICFADKHYNRLKRGSEILGYDIFPLSKEIFDEEIEKKLNGEMDARIRFVLLRNSDGFYTPNENKVRWEIELFPLDTTEKVCERLGVFNDIKKICHPISNLKSGNAITFVMAGIFSKKNNFDDCIILNQHDRIAEAIYSNIFILRGDELITPPLTEGCVEGVMRQVVIEIAKYKGIEIDEVPLYPHELTQADEIFLTNSINGIISVKSFSYKKYPTTFASFLRSFTGF